MNEFFFEIPEIEYDRDELLKVANQLGSWEPFPNDDGRYLGYDYIRYLRLFEEFPYVKQFKKKLKISTYSVMCCFNRFPPNYQIGLHKDFGGRQCAIQFPLWEDRGGRSPVKFVRGDEVVVHDYSTKHPTIINTQQFHDVTNGPETRILFQIGIYRNTYEDVLAKYQNGELLER